MKEKENNSIFLSGEVSRSPVYSHTSFGEDFFLFFLRVMRKSGRDDEVRVIVSQRLLQISGVSAEKGDFVELQGQIRTYNQCSEEKMHLVIFVFCRRIRLCPPVIYGENRLTLSGFLCRKPIYRVSPLGREICDLMLAVNRRYGKSDYIPCIVWGRSAAFAALLPPGNPIQIHGRFQSRNYRKMTEAGECQTRTAYEVSAASIEIPGTKREIHRIKCNY